MSSAPTPVVTWIVDVTCAVDGQQVVHRLALQTQGPAALDRDVTERAARNRRWLAAHGIDPSSITHTEVMLDDKEQNP